MKADATQGPLSDAEVRVFSEAVTRYFRHSGGDAAAVRAAFLHDGSALPPTDDYTGLIALSGAWRGCVYFSAPTSMLRQLLATMNERGGHDAYLDAVGEIANTIAGNARRHFGESLEISVPVTAAGSIERIKIGVRARPLVLAVEWRGLAALLVVDMERAA